jgi:hypothetical protein
MRRRTRAGPGTADRATLVATGLALVALPGLAAAAGLMEPLLGPQAVLWTAAVALSAGSAALARGRDPVRPLADARVWLATALLVDVELAVRVLDGVAVAGLGAVYASVAAAFAARGVGATTAAGLDAGFAPFCLALGFALVAVHDAAQSRRAADRPEREARPPVER